MPGLAAAPLDPGQTVRQAVPDPARVPCAVRLCDQPRDGNTQHDLCRERLMAARARTAAGIWAVRPRPWVPAVWTTCSLGARRAAPGGPASHPTARSIQTAQAPSPSALGLSPGRGGGCICVARARGPSGRGDCGGHITPGPAQTAPAVSSHAAAWRRPRCAPPGPRPHTSGLPSGLSGVGSAPGGAPVGVGMRPRPPLCARQCAHIGPIRFAPWW